LLLPAAVAALAVIQVTGCGGSDTSTSASATTAAAAQPTANDGAYVSVSDALAVVREHVEVPVAIPSGLPAGVTALDPVVHRGTAQLTLAVPGEGFRLVILYGRAGFDGCGPLHPSKVTVNGGPAVLDELEVEGQEPRATLVWPATTKHLVGRFGLYGRFSGNRLLEFASSMTSARAAVHSRGVKSSC
jgi:hypothetical protein